MAFPKVSSSDEGERIVQKRDWGTITIDILEATLTPQKKTRIMYKVNLNYERLNKHLCVLVRKGFIVEAVDNNGNSTYMISKLGRTFLVALRKVQNLAFVEQ